MGFVRATPPIGFESLPAIAGIALLAGIIRARVLVGDNQDGPELR